MALRMPEHTTDDERHTQWICIIERVSIEQIEQGWRHYMFRLLRAVFRANTELSAEGGFIFDWLAQNYIDAALMLIRRELDLQANTENIRNLLEDIIEHPHVLTRARYRAHWPRDEHDDADRIFNTFDPLMVPGSSDCDHIDPAVVRGDLDGLNADAERLRQFAERTRAHRTPRGRIDATVTFGDLHQAISDIRQVVGKYHRLLTLESVARWEPTPQFDTISPFTKPWVTNPNAVSNEVNNDGAE